ncbi:MAG: tetratricopeptide repeat protein [Cyclonatronaceae bacterium]
MKVLASFVVFLILFVSPDRAREANRAYDRGDYETAEQIYRELLSEDPGNTRVLFNLGNTFAKQQKYEEAIEAFERFKRMTDSAHEQSIADYNIGNLHSEREQWNEAVEQYRKALRQNPADDDARYNYELARRMQQEQPQQQQQQQQQQGDGDSSQQDQSEQDQQQRQQDQDESDSQDQQQQDQQQGGQGDQQRNEQQRPQDMEGQLSPEEAERMLNALESKEKDLLKEHLKQQVPPTPQNAKDW